MFARAGVSIAMSQAPERVSAATPRVTKPTDENGVASANDDILLPSLAGRR